MAIKFEIGHLGIIEVLRKWCHLADFAPRVYYHSEELLTNLTYVLQRYVKIFFDFYTRCSYYLHMY